MMEISGWDEWLRKPRVFDEAEVIAGFRRYSTLLPSFPKEGPGKIIKNPLIIPLNPPL
jgi:hypothetical protein